MSWLKKIADHARALLAPEPPPPPAASAQEAMRAIRADKLSSADERRWREARAAFLAGVFSRADRERLWKRHRRNNPDAAEVWEPPSPTDADLACLEELVRGLGR